MKIALCISGMLRNYKHTYSRIRTNILDAHSPDVFFYGYSNKEGIEKNTEDFKKMYSPVEICVKEYTEQTKNFLREDTGNSDRFLSRKRAETDVDRFLSQYYNLQKVSEMVSAREKSTQEKYDVIIRSRCDVFYWRPIEKDELALGASGKILIPNEWDFADVTPYGVSDTFAICDSATFQTYASLYSKIGEYFDAGCLFHHESMMGYHMREQKLDRVKIRPHFWFEYPEELQKTVQSQDRKDY